MAKINTDLGPMKAMVFKDLSEYGRKHGFYELYYFGPDGQFHEVLDYATDQSWIDCYKYGEVKTTPETIVYIATE